MAGLWSVLKCGSDTRSCGVLRSCGRAPVRAPFSGRRGSDSMVRAWVGPLYWIQWAGGHRRLHPRGRRNGPGGVPRLPDRATARRCAEPARSVFEGALTAPNWPKIDPTFHGVTPCPPRHLTARWGYSGRVSGAHSRRNGLGPETAVAVDSPRAIGCSARGRRIRRGAFTGAHAVPAPLSSASFMAAWGTGSYGALVVHSLWRRRCGGWWGGAAPPRGPWPSERP